MATVKGKAKSELILLLTSAASRAVRNLDREILNSFVSSFKQYSRGELSDRQVALIDSILDRLDTIESVSISEDDKSFVQGIIRKWFNNHPMYLANVPGKNSRVEKIRRKLDLGDPLEQRDWDFLRGLNKGYTKVWESTSPGGELAPGNLCRVYPAAFHHSFSGPRVECLVVGNRRTSQGSIDGFHPMGEILIDVFYNGAVYAVPAAHVLACRPRAPRQKKNKKEV